MQALTQNFVGRPFGDNGGAIIWDRRSLSRDEMEHVARALAKAAEIFVEQLGCDLVGVAPEMVFATIENDEEAMEFGLDWIKEVEDEKERREQIVAEDMKRRGHR